MKFIVPDIVSASIHSCIDDIVAILLFNACKLFASMHEHLYK